MTDRTIVYYTANREKPELENKIIDNLIKASDGIPIISVSHKPMDLGTNICVGERYPCDLNIYRQLFIGCEAAKTKYVISAESDFLYSPEYFTFNPKSERVVYRCKPVYILYLDDSRKFFYEKRYSEGGQIVGRDFLLKRLNKGLSKRNEWGVEGEIHFQSETNIYSKRKFQFYNVEKAIISLKTGAGLRPKCGYDSTTEELPYWGSAEEMKRQLWG